MHMVTLLATPLVTIFGALLATLLFTLYKSYGYPPGYLVYLLWSPFQLPVFFFYVYPPGYLFSLLRLPFRLPGFSYGYPPGYLVSRVVTLAVPG